MFSSIGVVMRLGSHPVPLTQLRLTIIGNHVVGGGSRRLRGKHRTLQCIITVAGCRMVHRRCGVVACRRLAGYIGSVKRRIHIGYGGCCQRKETGFPIVDHRHPVVGGGCCCCCCCREHCSLGLQRLPQVVVRIIILRPLIRTHGCRECKLQPSMKRRSGGS